MTHYLICQDAIVWSIVFAAVMIVIAGLPRR